MSAVSTNSILSAVENQRVRLFGVIGVLQCMEIAARGHVEAPELESAVALLVEQIQDITEALERPILEQSTGAEKAAQL